MSSNTLCGAKVLDIVTAVTEAHYSAFYIGSEILTTWGSEHSTPCLCG